MATHLPGIQDILYHILAHLASDLKSANASFFGQLQSQATRQTLARLAMVHSSFTRPTLSVLWRYLRTDKALLHLLTIVGIACEPPRKDWQWDWHDDPPLEMRETPEINGPSWTRFQEYASLVQEITLDPFVSRSRLVRDTLWCQLSSTLGTDTCILPRLRVVTLLNLTLPYVIDFLDMGLLRLINPSIHTLSVLFPHTGPDAEVPLRRVLSATLSSLPHLDALRVEVPVLILDIDSLAKSQPRLRRLELAALACHLSFQVDARHLATISSFRSLEHLSVSVSPHAPPDHPLAFPALRSLGVSSVEFSAIGALITHIDAPKLQSFSLIQTHHDTNTKYQEVPAHLHMLVTKCPHITDFSWTSTLLRSAPIPAGPNADTNTDAIELGPEPTLAMLMEPLLALPALRSFWAWFQGPAAPYSPADFRAFAEAWPALEVFNLYHDRDWRMTKRASEGDVDDVNVNANPDASTSTSTGGVTRYADPESILCFARSCPHLRELRLPTVRMHWHPDPDPDTIRVNVNYAATVEPHRPSSWPCTVSVQHVLYHGPREQSQGECSDGDDDDDRRDVLLRDWMQRVLPRAVVSFPLRFKLSQAAISAT